MATKTKTLPKEIKNYIDNSVIFTMFGIVNLNVVRTISKTDLTNEELIKLIDNQFAKEFVDNKIEYLGLSKK